MDVVFLDANVLFSGAYKEATHIRRLWDLEGVELVTSTYAAEEARRNLANDDQKRRLERLLRSMRIVPEVPESEQTRIPISRDVRLPPDDVPILLAAVAARASHLLTGDVRHYRKLFGREVHGVLILRPAEYLHSRAL